MRVAIDMLSAARGGKERMDTSQNMLHACSPLSV
jgi:hypothetical protein